MSLHVLHQGVLANVRQRQKSMMLGASNGAITFTAMTLSITTFSIMGLFATQHKWHSA